MFALSAFIFLCFYFLNIVPFFFRLCLLCSGEYNEAFAVYERGVLIISGIYGVDDVEQQWYTDMEILLDLNMAACKLKLKQYQEAIDLCKMV